MGRRDSVHILTSLARRFRRDLTPAERMLWSRLRSGGLGAKFRRQVPIAKYVVDFLCLRARLVVEVDGDTHAGDGAEAEDWRRTLALEARGLRIIRFTNRQVLDNLDGVLDAIQSELSAPSPPPSPDGKGS